MGLKVVEISSCFISGMEWICLKKAIKSFDKSCCDYSKFQHPLGGCMPDEIKRELVELINKHDIPLIEDDIYGDFNNFGKNRRVRANPMIPKAGDALFIFSKSLIPGYRIGWTIPGKFN
jgi:DNA-binding transcriptional MocR family regulator